MTVLQSKELCYLCYVFVIGLYWVYSYVLPCVYFTVMVATFFFTALHMG